MSCHLIHLPWLCLGVKTTLSCGSLAGKLNFSPTPDGALGAIGIKLSYNKKGLFRNKKKCMDNRLRSAFIYILFQEFSVMKEKSEPAKAMERHIFKVKTRFVFQLYCRTMRPGLGTSLSSRATTRCWPAACPATRPAFSPWLGGQRQMALASIN